MRAVQATLLLLAAATTFSKETAPLYKQCDPKWGNDEMGDPNGHGHTATICQEGCAMTSAAMGLAARGIKLGENGNSLVNPASLNTWLKNNNGYVCIDGDCDNLVLSAPTAVPGARLKLIGELPKPPLEELREAVLSGDRMLIAHVHNNGHFVLITGLGAAHDEFAVNDPFYNSTSYPYANISDIIQYQDTASNSLRGGSTSKPAEKDTFAQVAGTVIPFPAPLYKQCDSRWGSDLIDTETICQVGCLMSSTSMAIAARGINKCPGAGGSCNPGTLNSWLRSNGGYTGNDLIESQVAHLDPAHISWPSDAMHRTNDVPLEHVQSMLKAGRPVIANVMHGEHFVLVVGWNATNPDALAVNDPGFDRGFYSYSQDVVGWRLYNMTFNN